jgi:predicted CXXCH cytochrome family protein
MSQFSLTSRVLRALSAVLLMMPLASSADADVDPLPFSDLVITEPDRHFSATQECVEPEEEMRRNHMNYILHQRDKTVHDGIRTRQYALEECINCHASKGEDGEYIRVEDSRHFCASCHTYASVKIDCFQCHADVPVRASTLHQSQSQGLHQPLREKLAGDFSSALSHQLVATEGEPQ